MLPPIRVWIAAAFASVALACDSRSPATAGFSYCDADAEAGNWREGPFHGVDTSLSDSGATPLAGLRSDQGQSFAFDRTAGSIIAIADDGMVRRRIGRPGQGPGELAPVNSSTRLSRTRLSRDWLLRAGDTLIVLDGNQFHRYLTTGRYLASGPVSDSLLGVASLFPRETSRISLRGGRIWLDVSHLEYVPGAGAESARRTYAIWSVADTAVSLEHTVRLPTPPITPRGAVVLSGREARPMFALAGQCVLISDGGSPWLLVFAPHATQPDTLRIHAHLRDPVLSDAEAAVRAASGAGNGPAPDPALPGRLRQIIVDAGGWVWILPVQPESLHEGVEVIRIHVTTGVERVDTVPFFPTEFLPGGGFITIALDSLGVPMLRRALPTQRP